MPSTSRPSLVDKIRYKWYRANLPDSLKHNYKISKDFDFLAHNGQYLALLKNKIVKSGPLLARHPSTQGRQCSIIASGPSLLNVGRDDIRLLPGDSICVNGTWDWYINTTGITPTYYTATDKKFIANRFEVIESVLSSEALFFTTPEALSIIASISPKQLSGSRCTICIFEIANRKYFQPKLSWGTFRQTHSSADVSFHPEFENIGLSVDPTVGVFCGKTIAFRALQIALILGYTDIDFFGLDMGGQRFYHEDKPQISNLDKDFIRSILPSFELCTPSLHGRNFRITNHSTDSRIPDHVLPRTSER